MPPHPRPVHAVAGHGGDALARHVDQLPLQLLEEVRERAVNAAESYVDVARQKVQADFLGTG